MSSKSLLGEDEDEEEDLFPDLHRIMEARAEHQRTKNYRLIYSLATCIGVLLVILVLVWCLTYGGGFTWNSTPSIQFNWHPMLMVLGLVFFYAQSMLIYRTARYAEKKNLKIAHTVLHCTAFILAIVGLKAVFDSHNYASPPIPNLYSLHSWIGLTTVIIFALQFVFGFVSFLFPGLPRTWRQIIMPVHTASGIAAFVSSIVTCMMGLTEKAIFIGNYSALPSESFLMNIIGVLLIIFGLLVLYLVTEVDYKRAPLASDELALAETE